MDEEFKVTFKLSDDGVEKTTDKIIDNLKQIDGQHHVKLVPDTKDFTKEAKHALSVFNSLAKQKTKINLGNRIFGDTRKMYAYAKLFNDMRDTAINAFNDIQQESEKLELKIKMDDEGSKELDARYDALSEKLKSLTKEAEEFEKAQDPSNIDWSEIVAKQAELNQARSALSAQLKQTTNPEEMEQLKAKLQEINSEFDRLAQIASGNYGPSKEQIERYNQVKEEIKKATEEIERLEKQINSTQFVKDEDLARLKELKEEYAALVGDLQANPLQVKMNSNTLKDYNKRALQLQQTWKGVNAEMRKYNFLASLGRSIVSRMKFTLVNMLNPLNHIRKIWSEFGDQNEEVSNTFKMIGKNLVKILTPALMNITKLILKGVRYIDYFQMGLQKAFGVQKPLSLFDKQVLEDEANEAIKQKKRVYDTTLGFDELHTVNDGENEDDAAKKWNDMTKTLEIPEINMDWAKKLMNWGEKFGNLLKWIKDHWKELVALWAAFKIGKGLLSLLDWGKGLSDILGGLSKIGFGNLLAGLAIVAGSILEIKTLWDSIQWSKDFYGMNKDERQEQGNKNITQGEVGGALLGGGIGFLVNGPTGAVIGAALGDGIAEAAWGAFNTAVSAWKGDTDSVQNFSKRMGKGLGKTAGVIAGAAIGTTLGGPLGAAIGAGIGWVIGGPIGEAIGEHVIGPAVNGLLTLTRGKGPFQKLKVNAEDVENAHKNAADKTKLWKDELAKLQQMEKQTGESGEALYKAVENGEKSYWGLNDAQKAVYDQYKLVKDAEEQATEARKQDLEVSAKYEEQEAKNSGNFKQYIATMKDGVKEGIISHKDMVDYFAQTYGSLDEEAKKTFVDQLPGYLKQSVKEQGAEYETFGNKTAKFFKDWGKRIVDDNKSVWTSVKDGWNKSGIAGAIQGAFKGVDTWFAKSSNGLKILNATQEDVEQSTKNLADAQKNQNEIQTEVDRLQQLTGSSAEELFKKLADGEIQYENLTTDQQALVDKYADLQEAMTITDECAKKNVENMASVDLQAAKTSGNYNTFIENLKAANERGEISTDEMNTLFAQAYADMDNSARESFRNQAEEHGLMVDDISKKSGEYLGILGNLKKGTGEIWSNIKDSVKEKSTELAEKAKEKFEDLKQKAGEKWESIRKTAGEKWEQIKNSAVGQKVQEIWNNTKTKFDDLKTKVSQGWDTLKTNAKTAWDNIKNSIVDAAKGAWEKAQGFFKNIGDGVKNAWEGVKNFGKSAANWVQGKGWTPNSYDVGTNYVPNDQLAYIHKGEAIIPAKYNTPYRPEGNGQSNEVIAQMTQEIGQLRQLISSGIPVKGEFRQRGSDLVAVVEKGKTKNGNQALSNPAYAR